MGLDLEIAGAVREVADGEVLPSHAALDIGALKDSHHAVAKLFARGLRPHEVALQTGYSLSRISRLQGSPAFQDLIVTYRADQNAVASEVEQQFLLVAKDAMQVLHDRVLDDPETIRTETLVEVFKTFTDRAGYAPVSRTVNKNINLNIGERLDQARKRRGEAA